MVICHIVVVSDGGVDGKGRVSYITDI